MGEKVEMKKRFTVLLSDSILLIFLGLVYAWSVFKKPLSAAYGWNDGQLTWTFTICMFLFCLGGFAGAELAKKMSHRTLTWICAVLVGLSFILLGFMTSLWQLYVLYGGVIGLTVGIVYNCVLATGNKWYPDKGGLVAGLLLMFFGAGPLFLGPLVTAMAGSFSLKIVFLILGILFAVFLFLCGFFVRLPKEGEVPKVERIQQDCNIRQYTPKEMLKTRNFWYYLLWAIMFSSVGMALLGQLATIFIDGGMTPAKAAVMVSIFSVCNGLGRFSFGSLYDHKGRGFTMVLITALFILGGVTMILGLKTGTLVLTTVSLIFFGLAYGGVTPTNANFARSTFGNENYATNFSLINCNLLVSVFLGQFVGSTLYMRTGAYLATAAAITIMSILALGIQFLIKDEKTN